METIQIEEIKKLVDELAASLAQTGHKTTVDGLRAITERFKEPSEVRPAVYALEQAVRIWLQNRQGLAQDASTQLTAQFLVDACKNALAQGAIRSLAPTRRESARKIGRLAAVTLAAGLTAILVPAGLLLVGVNWVEMLSPEKRVGFPVERGEEVAINVMLSVPAPSYDGVVDVTLNVEGDCEGPRWDDLACEPSDRLWSDGLRHATFNVIRPAEVNGIVIAARAAPLSGLHGAGHLLVFADKDAAPGDYSIPLEGAYVTAPPRCQLAVSDAGATDASVTADGQPCDPAAPPVTLAQSPIASVLIQVR